MNLLTATGVFSIVMMASTTFYTDSTRVVKKLTSKNMAMDSFSLMHDYLDKKLEASAEEFTSSLMGPSCPESWKTCFEFKLADKKSIKKGDLKFKTYKVGVKCQEREDFLYESRKDTINILFAGLKDACSVSCAGKKSFPEIIIREKLDGKTSTRKFRNGSDGLIGMSICSKIRNGRAKISMHALYWDSALKKIQKLERTSLISMKNKRLNGFFIFK